jgi:predicted CXXCH cytochrome family protein
MRRAVFATAWVLVTASAGSFLAYGLVRGERGMFVPGRTTNGHHQIEERCELCHDVGGDRVREDACLGCHRDELVEADDSHPVTLFRDPRNAAYLTAVDARRCVSCHVEHRPSVTGAMGVTRPARFCEGCHADISAERPSHRGLPFDGCADAGCHNYHDNRALQERFLVDHMDDRQPAPRAVEPLARAGRAGRLSRGQADAPAGHESEAALAAWAASAHAAAGINCQACHAVPGPWTDRPPLATCQRCHAREAAGFSSGKHGMRLAAGLGPMRPELARLPMRDDARGLELGCGSCHAAHAFDRRHAAVDACLTCHDDDHSRAYLDGPHHIAWQREQRGERPVGTGVSCATCHLPRVRRLDAAGSGVEHDQNAALRPIEAMARPVCMRCHDIAFSLAALIDRALVERNFRGPPSAPARTVDMARARTRRPPPAQEQAR